MINELHALSAAMQSAGIRPVSWHREYKLIPKISSKDPCVRILLSDGHVKSLTRVPDDPGNYLRKFGNNQGTFPAMNLAPLYRLTDETALQKLAEYSKNKFVDFSYEEVDSWRQSDNWESSKFKNKYRNSMEKMPKELSERLEGAATCEALSRICSQTRRFTDLAVLHAELEETALNMLRDMQDPMLALHVLFYAGKPDKDDYGSLSVIFDSADLEQEGMQTAGKKFTDALNLALMKSEAGSSDAGEGEDTDAFDRPFIPSSDPMPTVKLAGGFEVSLRTMFEGQPCQFRYQKIGNDSYPISTEKRYETKDALTWVAGPEKKEKTWINLNKDDILFVYPSVLTQAEPEYVCQFNRKNSPERKGSLLFEAQAAQFRRFISETRSMSSDDHPENIQIFVLRKVDKARTKVVYSRLSSPEEIIKRSENWICAAQNLPSLTPPIGTPLTPFPVEISNIMNRNWKLDGSAITDKYLPIRSYHGLELLLEGKREIWEADLRYYMQNCANLAVAAGNVCNRRSRSFSYDKMTYKIIQHAGDALVVTGMLLHWLNIRKEDYMNEFPYLLGQLLKASDSLHELYSFIVRDKTIPPQLVGNSFYVAASEMPVQTLAQLGSRMAPYLTWAKANRNERVGGTIASRDGEPRTYQGPTAGYLLSVYEKLCSQLRDALPEKTRFSDHEKAQLFIGYLAAFPKTAQNSEHIEEVTNEQS